MGKSEVIIKEDEPTSWVSPIVVVTKKNGNLRVCLDPRDLNRAIKREHYKLPTRDEIHAKFKGAKYFKWCIHLSRSLFLNFNYLLSVTAGGPESPRGHMEPSSTVDFGDS